MKRVLFAYAILIGLIITGCQKSLPTAIKGKPLIVVSVLPYVSIVEAIAGDTVTVKSAVKANFNSHTMEITPNQIETVQNADLFITIGEIYEERILAVFRHKKKKESILRLGEEISTLTYSENTNVIDMCKDAELHAKDTQDLHFWLSPKRLPEQITLITDFLTRLKPGLRKFYRDNANAYIKKVETLDQHIEEALHPYEGRALLVPHSALGYFCHDYNLVQIAVECGGKSPLPKDLHLVLDLAKNSKVVYGFAFPQFSDKGVKLIADRLSIDVYNFDPLAEDLLASLERLTRDISHTHVD